MLLGMGFGLTNRWMDEAVWRESEILLCADYVKTVNVNALYFRRNRIEWTRNNQHCDSRQEKVEQQSFHAVSAARAWPVKDQAGGACAGAGPLLQGPRELPPLCRFRPQARSLMRVGVRPCARHTTSYPPSWKTLR